MKRRKALATFGIVAGLSSCSKSEHPQESVQKSVRSFGDVNVAKMCALELCLLEWFKCLLKGGKKVFKNPEVRKNALDVIFIRGSSVEGDFSELLEAAKLAVYADVFLSDSGSLGQVMSDLEKYGYRDKAIFSAYSNDETDRVLLTYLPKSSNGIQITFEFMLDKSMSDQSILAWGSGDASARDSISIRPLGSKTGYEAFYEHLMSKSGLRELPGREIMWLALGQK